MTSLLAHLQAQGGSTQQFLEILRDEELALSEGRLKDLDAIAARKSVILDRIAEMDHQRELAQQALGFPPGRIGADAAAASADDHTKAAWSTLLAIASEVKALNLRNGAAVYGFLNFTQRAMDYLKGSDLPVYGRDGVRKSVGNTGNRLAAG